MSNQLSQKVYESPLKALFKVFGGSVGMPLPSDMMATVFDYVGVHDPNERAIKDGGVDILEGKWYRKVRSCEPHPDGLICECKFNFVWGDGLYRPLTHSSPLWYPNETFMYKFNHQIVLEFLFFSIMQDVARYLPLTFLQASANSQTSKQKDFATNFVTLWQKNSFLMSNKKASLWLAQKLPVDYLQEIYKLVTPEVFVNEFLGISKKSVNSVLKKFEEQKDKSVSGLLEATRLVRERLQKQNAEIGEAKYFEQVKSMTEAKMAYLYFVANNRTTTIHGSETPMALRLRQISEGIRSPDQDNFNGGSIFCSGFRLSEKDGDLFGSHTSVKSDKELIAEYSRKYKENLAKKCGLSAVPVRPTKQQHTSPKKKEVKYVCLDDDEKKKKAPTTISGVDLRDESEADRRARQKKAQEEAMKKAQEEKKKRELELKKKEQLTQKGRRK